MHKPKPYKCPVCGPEVPDLPMEGRLQSSKTCFRKSLRPVCGRRSMSRE